jgi:hypothetical protein
MVQFSYGKSQLRQLLSWLVLLSLCPASGSFADGPRDNIPTKVRRIPALGVEVAEADRQILTKGLAELNDLIATIRKSQPAPVRSLLPDVEIYHRAVDNALKYQEFFREGDVNKGKEVLQIGLARARLLAEGKAPWTQRTGLVVRGYRSRIDHTVQPYGLVIPPGYQFPGSQQTRLDVWFHGRGETLSEVSFIDQRAKVVGQYAPRNTIVLHPYGRYSNAFKFAGETDVLEALAAVKRQYRVDENRIAMRGFSMGGAACWQFAVHYPGRWFAANPGAGFSETPEFLKFFQKEALTPTWYEKKLWHWYDCTDYAINLFHCPTVAYSGELDIQKQAADIMAVALKKQGLELVHLIGPDTKHRIHPDSKIEIERRLDSLAEQGRRVNPRSVHFTTYTLKYNRLHWVVIDALNKHWERAQVDAQAGDNGVRISTKNVKALTLSFRPGYARFGLREPVQVKIDGQQIVGPRPGLDRSWQCPLVRVDGKWKVGQQKQTVLRKRHGLQGPIDDALMDSFIFVRPSAKSSHAKVQQWTTAELERAIVHWRRHFRGDARVKLDSEITEEDIAQANLILWGDAESNQLIKKIAAQLPIQWQEGELKVGAKGYDPAHHAPIMIYPNPLNPSRYVVLNSSFTYRDYAYLNNARQVPMLPDWAIVDLRSPPTSQYPGKVVAADFFGEKWELLPERNK